LVEVRTRLRSLSMRGYLLLFVVPILVGAVVALLR